MGNSSLLNLNPCSETLQTQIVLPKTNIKTKLILTPIPSKSQLEPIAKNPPLKPPQLQKTYKKSHQTRQSYSTDEDSSPSPNQMKISKGKIHLKPFSSSLQSSQNIKKTQQTKTINKIFIFDWDDTLFFSTHLRKCKFPIKKSQAIKDSLRQEIDQNANFILKNCLEKGEVYIVTNSKQGWVKYSSEKFLPKTSKTIFESNKIKVISTRPSDEELMLCTAPSKCKYAAFKSILQQVTPKPGQEGFLQKTDLHLICIGDSEEQIDATNEIYEEYGKDYRNLYVKTIKLEDFPTAEDLLEEQQLLCQRLDMIIEVNKKLVIKLKR